MFGNVPEMPEDHSTCSFLTAAWSKRSYVKCELTTSKPAELSIDGRLPKERRRSTLHAWR